MARFDAFSPDFEHPFINSRPDYSSSQGTHDCGPIGDMSAQTTFRDRSKRLKTLQNEQNQLIEVRSS